MLDGVVASANGGLGGGVATGGVVVGGNVVDMLEIPGKGRCYIYFSRYSYDPFQQSLNDNPESELPLNAGEYVLVWGDTDEDGYLEGELLDGRKVRHFKNGHGKHFFQDMCTFRQGYCYSAFRKNSVFCHL